MLTISDWQTCGSAINTPGICGLGFNMQERFDMSKRYTLNYDHGPVTGTPKQIAAHIARTLHLEMSGHLLMLEFEDGLPEHAEREVFRHLDKFLSRMGKVIDPTLKQIKET